METRKNMVLVMELEDGWGNKSRIEKSFAPGHIGTSEFDSLIYEIATNLVAFGYGETLVKEYVDCDF